MSTFAPDHAGNRERQKFRIVDLDGTISDDRWRRTLIRKESEDPVERYKAYHSRCGHDPLINKELVAQSLSKDVVPVVLITARPENYRALTVTWLDHFGLGANVDTLLMRGKDDYRPSRIVKPELLKRFMDARPAWDPLVAFDDNEEVCQAYAAMGIPVVKVADPTASEEVHETNNVPAPKRCSADASEILHAAAETFAERNAVYKDNTRKVGAVMAALFPSGVTLRTAEDFERWHLFELKVVKVTRFVNSGLLHKDSIRDDAVYSAMIEAAITPDTNPINPIVETNNKEHRNG